jgi:hypothetical protein
MPRAEDICIAFLRARIERVYAQREKDASFVERGARKYTDIIAAALRQRNGTRLVAQCAMNIFLEYVGAHRIWRDIARSLTVLRDTKESVRKANVPEGNSAADICARVFNSMLEADDWFPFVCAANKARDGVGEESSRDRSSRELRAALIRGDFSILLKPCAITPDNIAQIAAVLRQYPSQEALMSDIVELPALEWMSESTKANARLFAAACAFRVFSLRDPARVFAEQEKRHHLLLDDNPSASVLACHVICQSSEYLRAAIPHSIIDTVIDESRAVIGDVSMMEEAALVRALDDSPLYHLEDAPVAQRTSWKVMAQLRENTFIGFNGDKRIIVCGPIKPGSERAVINIARIARLLAVPRDNGELLCYSSYEQTSATFAIFDAPIASIPQRIPRPADIVRALRTNEGAMRPYIVNCMWRFVMDFPGKSASADILVVAPASIFAYNELAIGSDTRNGSESFATKVGRVHKAVLEVFSRDVAYYEKIARDWSTALARIAGIECAGLKYCDRCARTGIDHALLSQCAGRAAILCETWMSRLN